MWLLFGVLLWLLMGFLEHGWDPLLTDLCLRSVLVHGELHREQKGRKQHSLTQG